MDRSWVFFIKAFLAGVATVLLIPKNVYQKFFVYSLTFGGLVWIAVIMIIGPVLHLAKYMNMGPFGVYGIFPFWTPIAYTFVFMFFLYALPQHKVFFYLYILAFGLFGYFLGLMLENYGVFQYVGIWRYLALPGLWFWFWAAAKLYMKIEKIQLE